MSNRGDCRIDRPQASADSAQPTTRLIQSGSKYRTVGEPRKLLVRTERGLGNWQTETLSRMSVGVLRPALETVASRILTGTPWVPPARDLGTETRGLEDWLAVRTGGLRKLLTYRRREGDAKGKKDLLNEPQCPDEETKGAKGSGPWVSGWALRPRRATEAPCIPLGTS